MDIRSGSIAPRSPWWNCKTLSAFGETDEAMLCSAKWEPCCDFEVSCIQTLLAAAALVDPRQWIAVQWNCVSTDMGMDQYLLIPFLVGWTSIYQLFWCSLGARVLIHPHMNRFISCWRWQGHLRANSGAHRLLLWTSFTGIFLHFRWLCSTSEQPKQYPIDLPVSTCTILYSWKQGPRDPSWIWFMFMNV